MYSPTTRLLTILELLQSYKQLSGSEIARRLEVDGRTVRRYIVMLQDMGFPVEAERGPYGTYQLQRGYKMPPLMFTDSEAIALTLGLISMREFHFPVDVAAVEGALAKTERVMPEKLLQQARSLHEAIAFNVTIPPVFHNAFISILSTAVQQRQQVFLRYHSFNGSDSERLFDPYGIVFNEGYWYTAGYCHLREGLRTFRLDRVVALEPREGNFVRPTDFDALAFVIGGLGRGEGQQQIEVFMETTLEHALEIIPPIMGSVEAVENGVMFRRAPYPLQWIAHMLMTLEFPVQIRQTEELRGMVRTLGKRALYLAGEE